MRRLGAVLVLGVAAMTACVDQEENAVEFCQRNAERLASDLAAQGVPVELSTDDFDRDFNAEALEDLELSFSKTMRWAEDATKDVREAARDVDDAYLDLHATYSDDDSDPEDYAEDLAELERTLAELREACAEHQPTDEAGGR